MNTTQAKSFYKKVDLAKLPEDVKKELEKFDKDTNGFSEMNEVDFTDFKEIKQLIEGAFPQAMKKDGKTSKAKPAARKILKAKTVRKTSAKKKAATPKKKTADPKAVATKKIAAPKKAKTPRVKSAPKPKAVRKVSATKSKSEKAMEAKRAKFDKMEKELKQYKAILKDNDKVKMEIACDAQRQYNKIVSLGKSKFEVDFEKLTIEHKLFKGFVNSDKSKLKSIRVKAIGKVEPSLGRAKKTVRKTAKKKKATKPKSEKKGFFASLFS
jgi:hypothetical protein